MTKGYYYDPCYDKYHVRVYRDGKYHHIGRFDTPEIAAQKRAEFIKNYEPPRVKARLTAEDSIYNILTCNKYTIARAK